MKLGGGLSDFSRTKFLGYSKKILFGLQFFYCIGGGAERVGLSTLREEHFIRGAFAPKRRTFHWGISFQSPEVGAKLCFLHPPPGGGWVTVVAPATAVQKNGATWVAQLSPQFFYFIKPRKRGRC